MKAYLKPVFLLHLTSCLVITSDITSDLLTNITEAYIGKYSQDIDSNVFDKIRHVIQTQIRPNTSVEQIDALIKPIRQKFYDGVHKKTTIGLQTLSSGNDECPNTSCSGSEVPSLILDIVKSSLNESLSAVNERISTLDSEADPPVSTIISPVKDLSPPAQTPQAPITTRSHGAPHFVSTIPADAPGAPNLSNWKRRAEFALRGALTSRTARPSRRGKPNAVSTIPKAAQFAPVPDPPQVNKACPSASKACTPNPPSAISKGVSTDWLQASIPKYLSRYLNSFRTKSKRRSILVEQQNFWRRSPHSSAPTPETGGEQSSYMQLNKNIVPIGSPSQDQISGDTAQINFSSIESFKSHKAIQEIFETILGDFVKDIEVRFKNNHDFLWRNLSTE